MQASLAEIQGNYKVQYVDFDTSTSSAHRKLSHRMIFGEYRLKFAFSKF